MSAIIGRSNGFSRNLRLLNSADYKRVFDGAEFKISHSNFLILARRSNNDLPRIGLVIAKKNVRFAVERNRIKRIIRESFRQHQADLSGLDVVVLARKGISDRDNRTLLDLFSRQWTKLLQRSNNQTQSSKPK